MPLRPVPGDFVWDGNLGISWISWDQRMSKIRLNISKICEDIEIMKIMKIREVFVAYFRMSQ